MSPSDITEHRPWSAVDWGELIRVYTVEGMEDTAFNI
jgi:hypothetical protein